MWDFRQILITLAVGAVGGILNCLLYQKGFVKPQTVKEIDQTRWEPGFLGNILMGAAAGFVVYAFAADELTPLRQTGLIFLGGLGGGNVLISFLQQHIIKVETDKVHSLENITRQVIESQ
jgi:hypothetical protein